MSKRLTIGFIDEDAYDEYHNMLAKGIFSSAQKHGINIIRFGHFLVHLTTSSVYQEKMLLDYVRQYKLDGLIILGWARATYNSGFIKLFEEIPTVSVGSTRDGMPGVFFMGEKYIEEIIHHLVNVHRMRKIAYISPFRADNRNDVFKEVMKRYQLFDPELYVNHTEMSGLSVAERGRRAAEILLDERKIRPEAIISLYNEETFEVIKALNGRGIRVPEDIVVTSYEDGEIGKFSSPAYTTVYFPWKELGYYACEAMYRLITKGDAPIRTEVPGKVVYRSSCGCVSQSAVSLGTGLIPSAGLSFDGLDDERLKEIAECIAGNTPFSIRETYELVEAFRDAYKDFEYKSFLMEFELKLRKIRFYDEYSEFEGIAAIFRKNLMPYFIPYAGSDFRKTVWADNMFHQMQVILQSRIANVLFHEDMEHNRSMLVLGEVGKILITNFNVQNLMDSLETNLPRTGVDACWIYLFNDPQEHKPFSDYHLEFEYYGGRRAQGHTNMQGGACELEKDIFKEDRPHFLLSHLLYVGDNFIGFVLFEIQHDDIRIARMLSAHISIALNGIILFEKLDRSYRKLMDQAHKKGMADTTGILHNIANIMNSVNITIKSMKGLLDDSCLNDLKMANDMLAEKFDELDSFIADDPKGKLLLRYYASLGDAVTRLRENLKNHIERLLDKTSLIEGIINTQQSFTGIKSNLERMDLIPVIEDVLKMSRNSIERHGIEVVRKYDVSVKALAQRTKLFHILTNIIKNAVESMEAWNDAGDKVLTVEVANDCENVYIRISDTGPGIEEGKLESIFAYGFTTKNNGHGFGLHSCANYMTEMKGRIWAENAADGRGACFVMQFRNPIST